MLCLSVTVKVFSVPDRASLLSDAFALARLVNISVCTDYCILFLLTYLLTYLLLVIVTRFASI